MLKKIGIIVGIIILIAAIGFGFLIYRLAGMAHRIESDLAGITSINLTKVADGVYTGSYGDFVVSAKVEVAVKNHRIKKITIVDQNCGPGYEAKDTVSRIIAAQSPKVDAVTGASSSSRSIMLAVARALKNLNKK